MKKKIISLCLVIALVATAIAGATLAYFTDTDTVENTFTMGKVEIDLTENEGNEQEGIDYEDAIVPGHVFAKDPTVEIKEGSEDAYLFLDVTLNKYRSLAPVMALDALADTSIDFDQADFNTCVDNGTFKAIRFWNWGQNNMEVFRQILNKWFGGINHADWKIMAVYPATAKDDVTTAGDYLTVRLAYIGGATNEGNAILKAEQKVQFMENFQMPASVTEAMIENDLTENNFNTDKAKFVLNFKAYAIQADTLENVEDAYAKYFAQN